MTPEDIVFDRSTVYDFVIGTCGYERRSSYVCRLGIDGLEKVAIVFPDTEGGAFDQNMEEYRGEGWSFANVDEALMGMSLALSKGHLRILAVDISSMPRRVIGRIIELLYSARTSAVDVHFIYCPGEFGGSARAASIEGPMSAGPISPFYAGLLRAPSIPIGLVVGLGLEPYRAAGVIELLEPARTWLFTAAMGDERFIEAAARVHSSILGSVSIDDEFTYDVRSLSDTYAILESLSFSVGLDYRLILAPSGPKLFSLACLLVGAARDDARPAVWRVGSTRKPQPMDVEEAGDVSAAVVALR